MARLFGMLGNRPDLGPRALAAEADALRVRSDRADKSRSAAGPLGWGLGFYQGGEVLMRRRPIDDRPEIDVAKLAADVRADIVMGHVRSATIGALRTENTHPFRYRQWLFAQTGTVSEFGQVRERLLGSVPEFLRAGIRGETDAELLFHVFLSFLHDAGRLQEVTIDAAAIRDALRSTLAVVDGMSAEVGGGNVELNVMVSNGELLMAAHRAPAEMRFRMFSGKNDAEMLIGDDATLRRKTPELAHMHFVILASDFDDPPPPRWKSVAQNAIVTLSRGQEPQIEHL